MAVADQITLRVTGYMWFDDEAKLDPKGARYVSPGDQIVTTRERFPFYGSAARDLVSGTLNPPPPLPPCAPPTPPLPPLKPFRERLVEKGKAVLGMGSNRKAKPEAAEVVEVHGDKTRFICPVCEQVFTAQKGLDLHVARAHPEPETEGDDE